MRLSDLPKLPIIACLFVLGAAMLCSGLVLLAHALMRGATPMLWLWGLVFAGLLVLRRAFGLLRRFRDPRAWRRPQHTPVSLALWVLGLCLALSALLFDSDSSARTLAVLAGGSLFILSGMLKRRP